MTTLRRDAKGGRSDRQVHARSPRRRTDGRAARRRRHRGAAPGSASLVIRHQTRGCHTWALNGGRFKATQSIAVRRGGWMTITDDDVMPHALVETAGPAVRMVNLRTGNTRVGVGMGMGMGMGGRSAPGVMNHMGASTKVLFSKAGVYRFKTRAGEDYMSGIKTVGEDNVLRVTVTVS